MTDETTILEETTQPEEETPVTVQFHEHDDGTVTASFPSMNGTEPFDVKLQNMHWGLVEDLEQMGEAAENADLLSFWREYVVGGPRAIPFKHTLTVFEAIRAYIEQVGETAKNA